ncbi:hypothetical protein KEM48_007956 [Puccinia striiformis f. sp. tritici PST-130]|nr:hypothetical protein KEM48_007956 [Puccinia striiformis f. sp. tritici PST-130]
MCGDDRFPVAPEMLAPRGRKLKARSANSIRLQWETKTRDPHARTAIEDVAAVPEMREMREAAGHETDEVRTGVNLMNVQVGPNVMSGVKELEGAEAAIEDRTTDMTTVIAGGILEIGKVLTTISANMVDTPEDMTRHPVLHLDVGVAHQAHQRKHSKKSKNKRDSSTSGDDRHETRKHSSKSKSKKSHKSRHRSPAEDSSDEHARKKRDRAEKKDRKRKKREKEKKKQKKEQSSKHKSAISEYGKYGIITEADMFTKDQEFRAWMVEEKMLNPETVSQIKMKELFKVYMEDFNTATLPHEKFYALEKYEARMNAIRSGNVTAQSDTYDPRADEAALAAQHKRVAKTDGEVYIGRAQLEQLRRIERERVEASRMKRMGMEVKESMGVRYEVD